MKIFYFILVFLFIILWTWVIVITINQLSPSKAINKLSETGTVIINKNSEGVYRLIYQDNDSVISKEELEMINYLEKWYVTSYK